jgi:hypothetical protein
MTCSGALGWPRKKDEVVMIIRLSMRKEQHQKIHLRPDKAGTSI